jgi:ABC-type glycerol-3-phosphate transport system substrate-binding protein
MKIYDNKELFEKANVEPPKTWDELLVVIDKLKATTFLQVKWCWQKNGLGK